MIIIHTLTSLSINIGLFKLKIFKLSKFNLGYMDYELKT